MSSNIDISIFTFSLGNRTKYLLDSINSLRSSSRHDGLYYEHHIIFQGSNAPEGLKECLSSYYRPGIKYVIHEWPQNIGIGAGINKILPELSGQLLFKMDDDCKIISRNILYYAWKFHSKMPNMVFSPYPVGLINNPGGPRGYDHFVTKINDEYFTLRKVHHVGGFARFAPAKIMKSFRFESDLISGISGNEDGQFSNFCYNNNIEMVYFENNLIVEHAESTLGQIARYPDYFSNRNNEKSMKVNIIE